MGYAHRMTVHRLRELGVIHPGWEGRLLWGGAPCRDIRGGCTDRALTIEWIAEADGQSIAVSIPLSRSPCNYGGERTWLLCPICRRRVTTLHLSSDAHNLACRHCYNMTYFTQNTDDMNRLHAKRDKLFRRLGAKGDIDRNTQIPRRPRGMWLMTYAEIIGQIRATENALDAAFLGMVPAAILERCRAGAPS